MLRKSFFIIIYGLISLAANAQRKEMLIYHPIETDQSGNIIPWFDKNPGKSYDHVIGLVWNFWDQMRTDFNGLPYYMNHQVWNPKFNDPRGIGGDQFAMALSSWNLYYPYTGNERVKVNMYFIADYYLSHGLSSADCQWPNLPFPYNTTIYSGIYDGDMRSGKGVLQPDKAGSFGLELVHLYKMSLAYNVGEKGNLKKFFGLNFEYADTNQVILYYRTYNLSGSEKIRLRKKPSSLLLDDKPMTENKTGEGFEWKAMAKGGLLMVRRVKGNRVLLIK